MTRITMKDLTNLLPRVAKAMNAPTGPLYTQAAGRNVALVGALFIEPGSAKYGMAWALCRMSNEQGGQSSILRAATARGLFDQMRAFLRGLEYRA